MNSLAPKSIYLCLFFSLPLVIICNPRSLAIGIAIAPKLPVPPEMKIFSPFEGFINSNA